MYPLSEEINIAKMLFAIQAKLSKACQALEHSEARQEWQVELLSWK